MFAPSYTKPVSKIIIIFDNKNNEQNRCLQRKRQTVGNASITQSIINKAYHRKIKIEKKYYVRIIQ